MEAMSDHVILETRDIVKHFPGVNALEKVSFELKAGEVHALIGENGAGKSTLIKILSGAIQPDAGEIILHDNSVRFSAPRHAMEQGIATIYQELTLAPDLTVAQNIMLGREPHSLNILDRKKLYEQAQNWINKIDSSIDVRQRVFWLDIARQQVVEIAKALALNAKIIIMDEPTSALMESEVDHLFQVIRLLAETGISVIFVTHRLDELSRVADRVTVLKDGIVVGTRTVSEIKNIDLIEMMTGLRLEEFYPPRASSPADILLQVQNLNSVCVLKDISFTVRRGEIVGVAGLLGAGQTELARAIFGVDPILSGEIRFKGKGVRISAPRDAIRSGMALLPEDRKLQGLLLPRSVNENITIANLGRVSRFGWLSGARERAMNSQLIKQLAIRTPSSKQEVGRLSGGNQQKVVLARWLASKADLLMFDEPTRGIDIGAKVEIYHHMRGLANQGAGILMLSSDLPELLGMSDRLLVMSKGRIVAEIPGAEAREHHVLHLMMEG